MSSFSAATKVFGVSLLAVPATYSFNVVAQLLKWDSAWPVCLGVVVVLAAVAGLLFWATGRKAPLAGGRKLEQIWFYALAISAFTSVASLTVGLELDGIISGFVNVYLKVGEPYLRCSHGAMASYWHGTVMYAMHLMMLAALTWDGNLYSVALFWCGSNINSTLVLLLGVATGKHGITPGAAFYLLVAIASLCFLYQLRHQRVTYTVSGPRECLFKRKHDIVFLLYLFAASFITIFRGLAVLGTNIGWINRYVATVEPYLQHKDPAPFPKMQVCIVSSALSVLQFFSICADYVWFRCPMLVYLFHHLPLQLASAYALLVPSCQWMPDLSLLIAGAVLQGQVSHIGASFHPRTPYVMRVPPEPVSWLSFWIVNLLLALGFQFLAYRCNTDPEFFAVLRSHSDRRMS